MQRREMRETRSDAEASEKSILGGMSEVESARGLEWAQEVYIIAMHELR